MTDEKADARDALAALQQTRNSLAASYDYPFARHLAFGLLIGSFVAAQALPTGLRMGALGLALAGIFLIQRWDRRRTGSFINGYRPGATRKVTALLLLAVLPILVAAVVFGGPERPTLVVALAGLATLVCIAFSYWWQAVYLRELGGEDAS
ncbi:hypothetical protein [Qipengyuania oceanensis]|uniref:Uncharacterized protein n=1 Tax=Qipengyuania oceanensis TaxID=1463597 RepID=A0A844YEM8_9SPHN|nr:hypothetical protein [Qipengyuania oceanensis]MXO62611.1 hypothetical protein [Qipengyuania oceanensis]